MKKSIGNFSMKAFFLLLSFYMISCNSGNQEAETLSQQNEVVSESNKGLSMLNRTPHSSINQELFKKHYEANEARWNKAFEYLKETNLQDLETGKHLIDGDDLFALVTQGPTKDKATTPWEAHKNYADIHWVISGKEMIGVAPVSEATSTTAYDEKRDIGFFTSTGSFYESDSSNFFIVFPEDAHCPSVKAEGADEIKKVVIKVKL